MQKLLRRFAIGLFVIATFAVASTNGTAVFGDGSGPVPLCYPVPCGPDGGN